MVGLGEGRVGVLGLIAAFSDLISDCVRGGKRKFRLVNCIFSFVSLVTWLGRDELGRSDYTIAVSFVTLVRHTY